MKFPDISKRPYKNIDMLIIGVLQIISGLCVVGFLGFLYFNFQIDYVEWRTKKMFQSRKKFVDSKAKEI